MRKLRHQFDDPGREATLKRMRSPIGTGQKSRSDDAPLDWDDIGFLVEGIAFASRLLREATGGVTERFDLGPRGAWMLNVISHGVAYPRELALVFGVGRSLITAELVRLTEAGLVETRTHEQDRRRTHLTLTDKGLKASEEIRAELSAAVQRRTAGFSSSQVRTAADVLHALGVENSDG